jgi:hypothetical protein
MQFSSPIWLVLLVPWAALAVWLLLGGRKKRSVPFLKLWNADAADLARPRREWRRPPAGLAALLLAMALAIAAAAQPSVRLGANGAGGERGPELQIDRLAVRIGATTQAMVSVVNRGLSGRAKLTIRVDGSEFESTDVALPSNGGGRNYFFDLPVSPSGVEARIEADEEGTSASASVECRGWAAISAVGALPADVKRMIEVYSRERPAAAGAGTVTVEEAAEPIVTDGPAAIIAGESSMTSRVSESASLEVEDHALTRNVDWQSVLRGAELAGELPAGWRAVVSVDGAAAVAVRDEPVREVWVGFSSEGFDRRADLVVFWTSVFDWLGGGSDFFSSGPQTLAKPENAPETTGGSLGGLTLLGAMGMMCLSAAVWKPAGARKGES